jgi:hypothetical protein
MNDQHDNTNFQDEPWMGQSEWFKYRCRSCDHSDWVEDIVAHSFPPEKPGGLPILYCPECGGDFAWDDSVNSKLSLSKPS